jgi:hypothetical protein
MIFADNVRKIPLIEVLPEYLSLLANWTQDIDRRVVVGRKNEKALRTGQEWTLHCLSYLLSRLTGHSEERCRAAIEPLITEPVG